MRVLADTNILLSAMWFKNSRVAKALLYVADSHELVICEHSIIEIREVIRRKAPDTLADAEVFLRELPYELITSDGDVVKLIRDPKDQPILNASIANGVDIILTGDKDFLSLDLDYPKPMKIARFLESEGGRAITPCCFTFAPIPCPPYTQTPLSLIWPP